MSGDGPAFGLGTSNINEPGIHLVRRNDGILMAVDALKRTAPMGRKREGGNRGNILEYKRSFGGVRAALGGKRI